MKRHRKLTAGVLGLALVAGLAACAPADEGGEEVEAPSFPTKPITFIVPYGAGGGADNFIRQLAPIASEHLGVDILIRNVPGVAGLVGIRETSEAAPDGYTITTFNPPNTNIAELGQGDNSPVTLNDMTPIAIYGGGGFVMVAHVDSPANGLQDVIDRYQSGEWTAIGAEAVGGPTHLIAEVLKARDGMNYANYVGYEGGEVSAAVMRQEVPVGILTDSAASTAVEAGQLKVIAVLYEPGSPFYPDARSMVEQGFEDLSFAAKMTRIVWGPPGMDPEIVEILAEAFKVAVEDPRTVQWAEQTGSPIEYGDAAAAWAAHIAAYEVEERIPNLAEILGTD